MRDFIQELRRRRVFRVAAACAVVAFVVAQVADIFFPGLGLPPWSLRLVLVVLILGFPASLIFAWIFDITHEGVVRTEGPARSRIESDAAASNGRGARRVAGWVAAGLTVALIAAGAWSVVPGRQAAPPADVVSLTAVAVFPFSVRGSPEVGYLGDGMVDTESSIAYAALAHLRLGEIHDRLGDAARAAQHYARFTAAWEHCDPEFQPLREQAERRLVALLAEPQASAASRRN
jgi:hypothetical protein